MNYSDIWCNDKIWFWCRFSCQGGVSMYEHIHIQREKTSLISKIQFIRQASYGMGYLHSREIVHKRLTTRNIFLCPNVRISAVDYGLAEVKYDRWIKSAKSWIYKTIIFYSIFFFGQKSFARCVNTETLDKAYADLRWLNDRFLTRT